VRKKRARKGAGYVCSATEFSSLTLSPATRIIERSILTLLNTDYNSLQVQNLARSFPEYDELDIDPAGHLEDISISTVIMDLQEIRACGE